VKINKSHTITLWATVIAFLVVGISGNLLFGVDPVIAGGVAMVVVNIVGIVVMAKANRKSAVSYVLQLTAVVLAAFVTARVKVLRDAFTGAAHALGPAVWVIWAGVAVGIAVYLLKKRFGRSDKETQKRKTQ
jgi:hypothetical protein